MLRRWRVTIPSGRIQSLFSRGSGNGGQNLHASNSRCMLKFNLDSADWIPLSVRNAFTKIHGDYVSSRGTVVIVREDTRSAADNQKLAMKQLQSMLDQAEEVSLIEKPDIVHETELGKIKSMKSEAQIQRYKDRMLEEKRLKSQVKRNRANRDWD